MGKWKIYTPDGVQDLLVEQCSRKREIEESLRNLFMSAGFFEIETPSIEFYDVFSAGENLIPQEQMFKFYDEQGRILALKPDMTIPVARIAATKLKNSVWPFKCSYIGNTFSYNEIGGGRQKEFTQAGVELLGVNTPEADAEIIALAIKSALKAGLEDFQIDKGQVEFFKGIMEESGLKEDEIEEVRTLIDRKDFVGVEKLISNHNIRDELRKLILDLPRYFGSIDVIDKVEKFKINERSFNALENLRRIISILEDYNLSKYVSIDLGMVQSLNYYTGIIFKGFTYGIGFPFLSGGRYDNLITKYGLNCPATGFSIGVNMVMMALERQGNNASKIVSEAYVYYEEEGRKTGYMIIEELRSQGLMVEMDISREGFVNACELAKSKGIGGVIHVIDENDIEVTNLITGVTEKTSIEKLLNK